MPSTHHETIVLRFFSALDQLITLSVIRGTSTFCNRYGINRRNLYKLRLEPASKIFDAGWLTLLASDYKVSPVWLLTGEGSFFSPGWTPELVQKLQNTGSPIFKQDATV